MKLKKEINYKKKKIKKIAIKKRIKLDTQYKWQYTLLYFDQALFLFINILYL
jgi:hypothetical protein